MVKGHQIPETETDTKTDKQKRDLWWVIIQYMWNSLWHVRACDWVRLYSEIPLVGLERDLMDCLLALLAMLDDEPVLLSSMWLPRGEFNGLVNTGEDGSNFGASGSFIAKNFSENVWSCEMAFCLFPFRVSFSSSSLATFTASIALSCDSCLSLASMLLNLSSIMANFSNNALL